MFNLDCNFQPLMAGLFLFYKRTNRHYSNGLNEWKGEKAGGVAGLDINGLDKGKKLVYRKITISAWLWENSYGAKLNLNQLN